jgi:DNA polymerase/3'-5' exonuclease PolX
VSDVERHPLAYAEHVAAELRGLLAPACERIEIAGSVRRRRMEVKDIELVAVPRIETRAGADLWGSSETVDALSWRLASLADVLRPRAVVLHRADGTDVSSRRVGNAYQALEYAGMPIDLFIVRPPAEWGVLFALRTGPGDWNTKIVTDCKRYFRRVSGGQVLHFGTVIPCPEERDFFAAVGQPWLDPWERTVERVHIGVPVAVPA